MTTFFVDFSACFLLLEDISCELYNTQFHYKVWKYFFPFQRGCKLSALNYAHKFTVKRGSPFYSSLSFVVFFSCLDIHIPCLLLLRKGNRFPRFSTFFTSFLSEEPLKERNILISRFRGEQLNGDLKKKTRQSLMKRREDLHTFCSVPYAVVY